MKNKFLYLFILLITSFGLQSETPLELYENCVNEWVCKDSDIDYHYRYFTIGTGPLILIPNIGLGYRQRHGQFGWDTCLSFSTIGYAHQLAGQLVGHYYLNPYDQNTFYTGLGLMGSGVFTNQDGSTGTISPDFVFGKELLYYNEHHQFVEMHIAMPTGTTMGRGCVWVPFVYIKYGVSF